MMQTQEKPPSSAAATPAAGQPKAERRVRISRFSGAGAATATGAALGALGVTWVLYERVLPFTGALGFWVVWYLSFLLLYLAIARLQGIRVRPLFASVSPYARA